MEQKRPNIITLDARGRSLGRVSSQAAAYLRGKMSASFERNAMPRQKVIILNAAEVRFTGRKLAQRTRERYSGYPSGLKNIPYSVEFKKSPSKFIEKAISGMLPRNRLKKQMLKNLTIYVGNQK